jgi:MFS family permease
MATPRRGPTGHLVMLTAAQTAGQAGTWAGYVAALPAALSQPHPAIAVSIITAAWNAPSVLARLAGDKIDRNGPRLTGATAWTLAAAAAAVPAVIHPPLLVVLVVLAVLAAGGTWGVSAGEAAPTWMPSRPDPATAGAWLAIATSLTLIIGPAGASNLLTYASDRAAWVLVATLSAAAALLTLLIPATAPAPTMPAAGQPDPDPAKVRAVQAITAGFYLTLGMVTVLEPLYVRQMLRAGIPVYGWLLAVVGSAGILASIAASRYRTIITGRWAVPAAALTVAAGEALYLNTPVWGCAFAGAAVFGTGAAVFRLSARAIIVRNTPGGEHGRALSGWETVQCLSSVTSAGVTGPLISVSGLRAGLRGCSALAALVAAASLPPARLAARDRSGSLPVQPVNGSMLPQRNELAPAPPSRTYHRDRAIEPLFPGPPGGGSFGQPCRRPPALLDPARFQLPQRIRQSAADRAAEGGPPRDGN